MINIYNIIFETETFLYQYINICNNNVICFGYMRVVAELHGDINCIY